MREVPIEGLFALAFLIAVIGWKWSMRSQRTSMADTHELSGQADEAGQIDYGRPAYGLSDMLAAPFKLVAHYGGRYLDSLGPAEDAERLSKGRSAADQARAGLSAIEGRNGRLSGLSAADVQAAQLVEVRPQWEAALAAAGEAVRRHDAAAPRDDGRPAEVAALIDGPADQRQHTICAIGPGGGKTTLDNAILLADLTKADRAGRPYQIVILNPHFSYYHPEQQPTDLRPLRGRFEAYTDYGQIRDVLAGLVEEAKRRKAIFNRSEGDDLGHTIVVHVDEWPDIAACKEAGQLTTPAGRRVMTVGEECAFYLTELLRLARKYGLYVILWAQDGRVETLAFHGGIRAAFMTRVVGRGTDEYDWKALIGAAHERPAYIERGTYYAAGVISGKLVGYVPDALDVAAALRAAPAHYRPMTGPLVHEAAPAGLSGRAERLAAGRPLAPADELAEEAAEPAGLYTAGWIDAAEREAAERWYDTVGSDRQSGRAFARWLYDYRGGTRAGYTGDGTFNSQVSTPLWRTLEERFAV